MQAVSKRALQNRVSGGLSVWPPVSEQKAKDKGQQALSIQPGIHHPPHSIDRWACGRLSLSCCQVISGPTFATVFDFPEQGDISKEHSKRVSPGTKSQRSKSPAPFSLAPPVTVHTLGCENFHQISVPTLYLLRMSFNYPSDGLGICSDLNHTVKEMKRSFYSLPRAVLQLFHMFWDLL